MMPIDNSIGRAFTRTTLLYACGLVLAFGWLWQPGLRELLLPRVLQEIPEIRLAWFGLALAASFLLYAPLASRLNSSGRIRPMLAPVLVHGLALVALLLAVLYAKKMETTPDPDLLAGLYRVLPSILLGLAGGLPGLWWTARLLAGGTLAAVAVLTLAAGITLGLMPLVFFLESFTRIGAWGVVGTGIFLAMAAACLAARMDAQCRQDPGSMPSGWVRQRHVPKMGLLLLPLALAGMLFFVLGSLGHHPIHGYPAAAGQVAGLLAVSLGLGWAGSWKHLHGREVGFNDSARGNGNTLEAADQQETADRVQERMQEPLPVLLALTATVLLILALCFAFVPSSIPQALLQAALAVPEVTAFALAASLCQGSIRLGVSTVAGLFLTLALVTVNAGYLAGLWLQSFSGIGPILTALAVALVLLGLVWRNRGNFRMDSHQPDDIAAFEHRGGNSAVHDAPTLSDGQADAAQISGPMLCPVLAEQLTERERVLAGLLIRGYSNKAICQALNLTENTVRWYIKKLNKKVDAADRPGLLAALQGK